MGRSNACAAGPFGIVALCFALAASALAAAAVATAGEGDNVIIVTANRYQDRYENFVIPAVSIKRRADFVVVSLVMESDTRDAAQRRLELEEALKDMARRTQTGEISLALLDEGVEGDGGETRLRPFTVPLAMGLLRAGTRPDTTRVEILARTAVGKQDTLQGIEGRLDAFLDRVPRPGRVLITSKRIDLSLVDPGQYRGDLIAAILADGRKALALAGPGHALKIEGLEGRIAWRRSGDLDLTLYLPHRLQIAPAGS
jgi:hypothetical protein